MAAYDGVAGSDAQVVERGFAVVLAGPQKRRAVTEETGPRRDDPEQDGESADARGEGAPHAQVADQFGRLRELGYLERIAGQKLYERIVAVPFSKSCEALLELRERGFG